MIKKKILNIITEKPSNMKITISGKPGSGKSTVARLLAIKLKYKHYSTGDFMRQMADEKKISLLELSEIAEKDRSVDEELDQWQISLNKEDNFVIDGRLSFHFIPGSVKIFLDANEKTRSKRILGDNMRNEHNVSLDQTIKDIKKREKSEKERYKEYYDLDPNDKKQYDLIIDTSHITAEQVTEKIVEFLANDS